MKLKRQRRFEAEIQTSSLNDIMFFLMLFFLIVSTLGATNAIKLNLPKSKQSSQEVIKNDPITLSITKQNEELHYFIGKKEINFPELENELMAATKDMEEPTVVIRPEQILTVQELVDVMGIGAKTKVRMVLATEKSK
ncbi:MAG: ExbD/TolR family protein [Leadbetterella sp.]